MDSYCASHFGPPRMSRFWTAGWIVHLSLPRMEMRGYAIWHPNGSKVKIVSDSTISNVIWRVAETLGESDFVSQCELHRAVLRLDLAVRSRRCNPKHRKCFRCMIYIMGANSTFPIIIGSRWNSLLTGVVVEARYEDDWKCDHVVLRLTGRKRTEWNNYLILLLNVQLRLPVLCDRQVTSTRYRLREWMCFTDISLRLLKVLSRRCAAGWLSATRPMSLKET